MSEQYTKYLNDKFDVLELEANPRNFFLKKINTDNCVFTKYEISFIMQDVEILEKIIQKSPDFINKTMLWCSPGERGSSHYQRDAEYSRYNMLEVACQFNNVKVVSFLLDKGMLPRDLTFELLNSSGKYRIEHIDYEIQKLIIDVAIKNNQEVIFSNIDAIQRINCLVEWNNDKNITVSDKKNLMQDNLLIMASRKGFKEFTEELIYGGANINYVNSNNETALSVAKNFDIVSLLLLHGAKDNRTFIVKTKQFILSVFENFKNIKD